MNKILTAEGKFLSIAVAEGNSFTSLDKALELYSAKGKYKLSSSEILEQRMGHFVINTFQNPVGCLRISRVFGSSRNYILTGDSYGPGIADVMRDFIDVAGIKTVKTAQGEDIIKRLEFAVNNIELMVLGSTPEEIREQAYLGFLEQAKENLFPFSF